MLEIDLILKVQKTKNTLTKIWDIDKTERDDDVENKTENSKYL